MSHSSFCEDCKFHDSYNGSCRLSDIRILNGSCSYYEKPHDYDIKKFINESIGAVRDEIRELTKKNKLK